MPERCVVFGCSATPKERTVSLHRFPKDTRQAWIRFVQQTRKWTGSADTGTVCSQHFVPADFENLQKYKMGFATTLRLKPTAVPSIYPTASTPLSPSSQAAPAPRPAARKRELHRVTVLCLFAFYFKKTCGGNTAGHV